MPAFLRPMAPIAPDALLCGDPARALAIAQAVLVEPRMSNHHRGLWGYSGRTVAGLELSIQATGIGGPSAAAVFCELARLGMRRMVRVGTGYGVAADLHPLGSIRVAERVIGMDGASAAAGSVRGEPIAIDPELTALLTAEIGATAPVLSVDLPVDARPLPMASGAPGLGKAVVDLQSATLAALAVSERIAFGVCLAVTRSPAGRLEDDPVEAATLRAGRAGAGALETLSLDLR